MNLKYKSTVFSGVGKNLTLLRSGLQTEIFKDYFVL